MRGTYERTHPPDHVCQQLGQFQLAGQPQGRLLQGSQIVILAVQGLFGVFAPGDITHDC